MNWAQIRAQLVSAIQALGISDVGWDEQTARWRSSSHVRLKVLSSVAQGKPERRGGAVAAGSFTERVYQPRTLTVQVTCETQAQTLENSAWTLAETIASGIRSTNSRAYLDAAELGLASVSGLTQVDYTDSDGRRRSAVIFDIVCNTASIITPATESSVDVIETTVISSDVLPDIETTA